MDRLTQKETAGQNLINGRYMLNECLFASDFGSLYKARDTRQEEAGVARTSVLIHFLPNRTVAYNELPGLFSVLQSYTETLNYPVLKVADYGWFGTVAYFIMLAPESWSVNVLPDLQGLPSSLHQNAIRITRDLVHKGIVSRGLVPQAFLVMPGGLYLLPTALSTYFQALQRSEALLPLKEHSGKSGRWIPFFGWGAAVGFAVAGSGYIYHLYEQGEVTHDTSAQQSLAGKSAPQVAGENTHISVKVNNSLLVTELGTGSAPASLEPSQLDRPEAGSGILFAEAEQEDSLTTQRQDAASLFNDVAQESTVVGPDAAGEVKEVKKAMAVILPKHEKPLLNSEAVNEPEHKENRAGEREPDSSSHKKVTIMNSNTYSKQPPSPELVQRTSPIQKKHAGSLKDNPVSPNIQVSEAASLQPVVRSQQPLVMHSEPVQMRPVAIKPAPVVAKEPETGSVGVAAIEPVSLSAHHQISPVPPQKQKEEKEEVKLSDPPAVKPSGDNSKSSSPKAPGLTANGLTSEQLITAAYKAIRTGQLGELAGKGAVYYIRLVKRIDRGNPQINRMARKVASVYHVKARDAIRNKHKNAARQLLWMAGRVIKEFNLTQMNKSHEILKHRLEE